MQKNFVSSLMREEKITSEKGAKSLGIHSHSGLLTRYIKKKGITEKKVKYYTFQKPKT